MKKTILIIAAAFLVAACVTAAPGGIPFEVLHWTLGARALSMGEATVADPQGITTLYWNPAVLDSVAKNEIYAGAESLLEGASMEYVSYTGPIGKLGGLGVLLGYLDYGSYQNVDTSANPGSTAQLKDIYLNAGYGKTFLAGIQAGISLKLLVKSGFDSTFTAFNADLGFYRSFDMIDFGLAFKNLLPLEVKYTLDSEKFVSTMRLGFSLKLLDAKLRINCDMEKYFIRENPFFFAGVEYNLFNFAFLRAGYNTINSFSGGIGLAYQGIKFDYGLVSAGPSLFHKIALSYMFGGYETALKAEPEIFSPVGAYKKVYIRISARTKYDIFKWSLEIKNKKGEAVRAWSGAGAPDESVIWDGLRQDGMPFDEGEYKAQLTVVDENDLTLKSEPIVIKIQTNDSKSLPMFGE